MRGSVFKRCPHGETGKPARGNRPAIPACRQKHGSWWWRADAGPDPDTGKRRQPSAGGYPTQDDAQDALEAFIAGGRVDDRNTTVKDYLEKTWLPKCLEDLEPKTYNGYRSDCVNILIPHLGKHRLRDLTRQHVDAALRAERTPSKVKGRAAPQYQKVRCGKVNAKGKPCGNWAVYGGTECGRHGGVPAQRPPGPGRGGRDTGQRQPRTMHKYRRTLRAALEAALRDKLIAENVAAGRIDALPKVLRAEHTWWEPDQAAAFLVAVHSEPEAAMWEVAAFGGLRRGELLGLRWEDVELDAEHPGLWLRQSLSELAGEHDCRVCGGQHRGRRLKPPKTDASARWVPLVPGTVGLLRQHRAAQDEQKDAWGEAYDDHGLVFPLDDGVPARPGTVTKRFQARAARAGLPVIDVHEMRHGACALLLAAGVPIEQVMLILGHANPAVTRQVYAHVLRAPASNAMLAAARLVRPDEPTPRAQIVRSRGRSAGRSSQRSA